MATEPSAAAEPWGQSWHDHDDGLPTDRVLRTAEVDDLLDVETEDGPLASWRGTTAALTVERIDEESVDEESGHPELVRTLELSASNMQVYELVAKLSPDAYEATITCIQGANEMHQDIPYRVTDARRVHMKLSWTVINRSGTRKAYHRPDPVAIAHDEAKPACMESGSYRDDHEFRIAPWSSVVNNRRPCIDCAMRREPVGYRAFDCPGCGVSITRSLFQGSKAEAVKALTIECPASGYGGDIELGRSEGGFTH